MPRPTKQATKNPAPSMGALDLIVRKAEAEAAKWSEVSKATRLDYEAKAKQLAKGWDLGSACKRTRYAMRAAGLWTMRRQLRRTLREAKTLRAKGLTGQELAPLREAMWAAKIGEAGDLLARLRDFEDLPWSEVDDPGRRLQASHKQKAATDAELLAFYGRAGTSGFRIPFMVAEFSGCRGQEFDAGVRVEASKSGGVAVLRFYIESAKSDGDKKGIDLRCVEVPFPSLAELPVQRRWLELAKLAAASKGGYVARIEPTAKMSAGQRFTNACKFVAKSAGVEVAAYSFRHRFSAQAKQANKGDAVAVALALGHQTTETQRHYARAKRGGGGVSPVAVAGINIGNQVIRGAAVRTGPSHAHKTRVALQASIRQAPPTPRRLRL